MSIKNVQWKVEKEAIFFLVLYLGIGEELFDREAQYPTPETQKA